MRQRWCMRVSELRLRHHHQVGVEGRGRPQGGWGGSTDINRESYVSESVVFDVGVGSELACYSIVVYRLLLLPIFCPVAKSGTRPLARRSGQRKQIFSGRFTHGNARGRRRAGGGPGRGGRHASRRAPRRSLKNADFERR
jgi:hypothetical protein